MLLTIHDAHLHPVASIDNDKDTTLNYFNDTWTRYFETGSAQFNFTVAKRVLINDTYSKRTYNFLSEKNFISFEYEGETQLFIVRKVVESEKLVKVNCVNLNLELINEYVNAYKAPKAMSFEEYCKVFDLLNFTMLKIGINEIADRKITAEWEGQDTKLARLLSLVNKFGAEIEFKTTLNDDGSIKSFVINVYHENDATHQGVGKVQSKVLRYGRDFRSLTRTVDTTGIYNATRPTGKTEEGEVVTIAGMQALEIKNEKGKYFRLIVKTKNQNEWKKKTSVFRGIIQDNIDEEKYYYIAVLGEIEFYKGFPQIKTTSFDAIMLREAGTAD